MKIAYLGQGSLDEAVLERMQGAFEVHRLPSLAALRSVPAGCEVLVIGAGAPPAFSDTLDLAGTTVRVVIDQTLADPDSTRILAAKLAKAGVALVDAPIHCELAAGYPEQSAVLCGGPVDAVRPVLDAMCPKVIHFGDTGTGQTARLVVGAIAACNRMITYECATVGLKNGLSTADMAMVLDKSSGQNSATTHVLPHLAQEQRTTDRPLAEAVTELRLAMHLAMRAGAPLMLPNLVGDLCQALANELPEGATFDDAAQAVGLSAGIHFRSH